MGQVEGQNLYENDYRGIFHGYGRSLRLHHAQVVPSQFNPQISGDWQSVDIGLVRRSEYLRTVPMSARLYLKPSGHDFFALCANCGASTYDGGLNKYVHCACGCYYRRSEDGSLQEGPCTDAVFEEVRNVPSSEDFPELVSISLGIFRDDVPAEFIKQGNPIFLKVLHFYLYPYFSSRSRCLGVGDYFAFGDAKFKVLGAFPTYGVVSEGTTLYCNQFLYTHEVSKIHLLSIGGETITEDLFKQTLSPLFMNKKCHIHTDQFLYLNGKEFIAIASQPIDGIVNENTEFFFEGDSLEWLSHIRLTPFIDDLPYHLQALPRSHLVEEMISSYILPYFQGFKRYIQKYQIILINGINFKVSDCYPHLGVSCDSTVFVYDGSVFRREFENISNSPPMLISDPFVFLARQQFYSTVVTGNHAGGADDITIQTLPTHRFKITPTDPEASRCMVCMNLFAEEEELRTLPCFHIYHSECIDQWLRQNKNCPVCKSQIDAS